MDQAFLEAAHKHCTHHRAELETSEICGCFHCLGRFPPARIREWTDEGQTAMCPRCGIDAVIGSASGYLARPMFLERMRKHWFHL